jgi:hypothetical protein
MGVDDLIEEAKGRPLGSAPPEESIAELKKIVEYNDSVPRNRRVPVAKALAWLKSDHNYSVSRHTFDRWFVTEFGRGWYLK